MDAYIYAADCYCEECGEEIRKDLRSVGKAPEDESNENTYDSDDFPKGPYQDAGGESDSPQHCAACGVFLENPLTEGGYEYVSELIREHILNPNRGNPEVLAEWARFYGPDGLTIRL